MTDLDRAPKRPPIRTQAGGRYDPETEEPPVAPGAGGDEVGEGVSVGDGSLAGPGVAGSNLPPAAGVVGPGGAAVGAPVEDANVVPEAEEPGARD